MISFLLEDLLWAINQLEPTFMETESLLEVINDTTSKICDDVVIGAGSVTKDIIKPGIYAGNPARFLKENPNL